LEMIGELGPVQGALTSLERALREAGRSFGELARVLPSDGLVTGLAELNKLPPSAGDELLEALWADQPNDPKVVAAAIRVAPRLPLERALEWSARIRGAGLDEHCPLITIATDPARPPDLRVRAAAIAAGGFNDERGADAI